MEGPRLGANVILESADGVVLQLRDDVDRWGIFGGLVAVGEDPEATALREIREELSIRLDPDRLRLLKVFEGPRYVTHLFHYRLGDELDDAELTEGAAFAARTRGDLAPDEVVPWHRVMLEWFWERGADRSG